MKAPVVKGLTASLARMPARQLHLLLGGGLAIVAALLWTFAVRAPLAQLRVQQAERARLAQVASDPALLARQLAAASASVAALEAALAGSQGAVGADQAQLQLRLIGALDRASSRHGVLLRGAVPGPAREVAGFQEVAVDVEAVGSYPALLSWMTEIDGGDAAAGAGAGPSAAIVSFDLGAGDNAGARTVKIRLAAYLLPKESK